MNPADEFIETWYENGLAHSQPFTGDLPASLAEWISKGAVIAPTETVYGVIALASKVGLETIAYAKGRSVEQLPPVLVSSYGDFQPYVRFASKVQELRTTALIEAFWPGSLTIVLPVRDDCDIPANGGVLALRHTPNDLLAAVATRVGPIYASSANVHGAPTVTGVQDLTVGDGLTLLSRVGRAFCSSEYRPSLASTIVEVSSTGSWRCHRVGAISVERISEILDL